MERTRTEIKRDIEKRYGLLIGFNEVMDLLRLGRVQSNAWLDGISFIEVNGRKRWMSSDIADKLYDSMRPPVRVEVTKDEIYNLLPGVRE